MQTIKQTVSVEFKAVELEDAMKMAPIMDILKVAAESGGTISVGINHKIALNALKTLSGFGFRMSDGSYYKEPEKETNLSPQPEAHEDPCMICKGTIVKLDTSRYKGTSLQIVKLIKDHFTIGPKEAIDATDTKTLKIPYDVTQTAYNKFKNELEKIDVSCIIIN